MGICEHNNYKLHGTTYLIQCIAIPFTKKYEVMDLSNLDPEILANYQRCFNIFDLNGDGKIKRSEIKQLLKTIDKDISESDIKKLADKMMENADSDGDDFLNLEEFIKFLSQEKSLKRR